MKLRVALPWAQERRRMTYAGKIAPLWLLVLACGGAAKQPTPVTPSPTGVPPVAGEPPGEPSPTTQAPPPAPACGGPPMRVAFYNAGQALAALITLPNGKHILVDTGESPTRPQCGAPCQEWHRRVMAGLTRDLGDAPIDLLWITHPHSDHIGGAQDVLQRFHVGSYVDNGRDLAKPTIQKTRDALASQGVSITVVDPTHTAVPLGDTGEVTLTAVVPPHWYPECGDDPNACSILLRIGYCQSSVLFTGDADQLEEPDLTIGSAVTLLQVGHHGSHTSSTPALLDQAQPTYAVISSGLPGEATNCTYCHPRAEIIRALTAQMGGPGQGTVRAFPPAISCKTAPPDLPWLDEPASDRLWATSRDGDVVLITTGDGVFRRE
jgi:competence protein ComEC